MRATWLVFLTLVCGAGFAADDFKVIKLEQDVRNLERQVQNLTRQLAELQQRGGRLEEARSAPTERSDIVPSASLPWLNAANWNRIRTGMQELEVITLLGPPTSMRGADPDSRTLLYAMEIGSSGFLSGSVQLRERRVVEVQIPMLR
jgi:hypothetical protein